MGRRLAFVLLIFGALMQQVGAHLAFVGHHGGSPFGFAILTIGTILFLIAIIRLTMPNNKAPKGSSHSWWCFLRVFMMGECNHK